jgi:CheY-like chemotaxis protein
MGIKNVVTLSDSRRGRRTLARMQSPVLFLDLNMPHMTGQDAAAVEDPPSAGA